MNQPIFEHMTTEEQATLRQAQKLGANILTQVSDANPEVVVCALIEMLKTYGEVVPELRLALGRSLLILGGRLTTTPSTYLQHISQPMTTDSTIH